MPPAAQALLAVQRSAGNAAASRMLARSPLKPPGPVGEITASIEALGYRSVEQASAVREVALGPAATFEGFESEQEAVVAAGGSNKIGVVVRDAEGRFHAYETDQEPIWGPLFSHVSEYDVEGGEVVRWTHLDTPGDAASYAEQIRYAGNLASHPLPEKRDEARRLYLDLLESAVGLKPSDIHDSTGGAPAPGKVSFDMGYTGSNAHAGVTGAVPSDRETALPVPILELGPSAFENLASLRATLLHEFTHLNHAKQTIAAVERWRATTKEGTFLSWLKREQKAGRIDGIDYAVIREHVSEQSNNTESLSYLVSFVSSYHLRDLAMYPADKDDDVLFGKLDQLSAEWLRADHVIQDHVIAQLNAYRDTLVGSHRERLDAFTAKRFGEYLETAPFRLFWGPLR